MFGNYVSRVLCDAIPRPLKVTPDKEQLLPHSMPLYDMGISHVLNSEYNLPGAAQGFF